MFADVKEILAIASRMNINFVSKCQFIFHLDKANYEFPVIKV